MTRDRIKQLVVAQLQRNGPTYGPFLRVVVGATPREWGPAVAELAADGQVVSDGNGTLRLA